VRRLILIAAAILLSTFIAASQEQQPTPPQQDTAPQETPQKPATTPQKPGGARPKSGARVVGMGTPVVKKPVDPLLAPTLDPDSPEAKAVEAMFGVHEFSQVVISPDGKQVAWVESLTEKNGAPSANSAIYIADLKDPKAARRVSAGSADVPHAESDVAWSPDSKRIAFLSDAAKPGQAQLYIAGAAGGAARRMSSLKGYLASPGWSPDGKTIAMLFTENATRAAGPLVAETPDEGVVGQEIHEQRLTLVDVAKDTVRQITPADMYIYEFDWSPDGTRFITTAAHGNGDDNWYVAGLYTVDLVTGETKLLYQPKMQIAVPHFSPGGDTIAYIGGLMSDEISVGGDVYVLPAAGGEPRDMTPNINATPSAITWINGGRQILINVYVDGRTGVALLDLTAQTISVVWTDVETISAGWFGAGMSVANDGVTTAVIRQSFVKPPEVWAGEIGDWKQITARNEGLDPAWGPAQSIHWTSDSFKVQGWLHYPPDVDTSIKHPLVVAVHGGPAAMVSPMWPTQWSYEAALAAAGFFVLEPNPRGSYGSGETFTRANVKDFGYGDFRDILAGITESLAAAPIDNNRVGITGWSYGGFMTMWAVTQTDRFKAAVAGAGLSNYQSYYGENGIDQWMIPYFGASVYDDPAIYAKSSPITFIKKAKTPTLIVVGDRDGECPPPQSYEFWHALLANHTETQFVIYPNEGHMFVNPDHSRDVVARAVAWFKHYL
jgi:dipeptidyl aminopeptidase/acylaminoacyl peptidase